MRPKAVLWASASGLALALAFPKVAAWPLAWIALVPLFVLLTRDPSRAPTLCGACGFSFHAANLPWIRNVMMEYGGISPPLAVGVYLLLIVYLTLFWIVFGLLLRGAFAKLGVKALLLAPFFWVALELARKFPFGGFPWCLVGYSQVSFLPVLQLASLTGIHGISFLLIWVQVCVALWWVEPAELGAQLRARLSAGTALVIAIVWGFGFWSMSRPLVEPSLSVAAVQGNVQQGQKWDPQYAMRIFSDHMALSQQAADGGAELIVWPESSTPFYFDGTPQIAEAMKEFARANGISLLFGGDDRETDPDGTLIAYNGAKLIKPDGSVPFRYRKMFLVPFGEYVPMSGWLDRLGLESMVQAVGEFRPGTDAIIGPLGEGEFGVSICYEVIHGDLTREFINRGAGLLLNITNDAWFGTSAAPYQHLLMARARTVETRRYMVRAANTGISAFIDPYGRLVSQTELFEQTVLSGRVELRSDRTFYVRYGNLIGLVSLVVTCFYLGFGLKWTRAESGAPGSDKGRSVHR